MRSFGSAIGAGLVTALVAAFLFWIINQSYRINNVGLLRRQNWPVNDPWMWAAVAFAIGFVGLIVRAFRRAAYVRDVRNLAAQLGLDYSETATLPPGADAMPAFAGWSSGRHAMTGSANGVSVAVFDCTTILKGDESDTVTDRTVALIPAVGLPTFDLRPRTVGRRLLERVGFAGLSFDPSAADPTDAATIRRFTEQFQLFPGDPLDVLREMAGGDDANRGERELAIRQLFTADLLAKLNDYPQHACEANNGYLAVWRGSGIQAAGTRSTL